MSTTEPERRAPLLEVGRIAKPHGLAGEVVVDLLTNRTERLDVGTVLFTDSGARFVVSASKPFGTRWIVSFEEITDRLGADRARGLTLFGEPIEDDDALWVDELVGSDVVDQNGRELGKVTSLVANPASDILELEGGGLIPLVFLVERVDGRLLVDIPDGLIE